MAFVTASFLCWPIVAQAAQGKQVLDDWVAAADASALFDLSYASASEDSSLLKITDLEISISIVAVVQFFSTKIGFDIGDIANNQQDNVKYVITLPEVSIKGLTDEATYIAADEFNADAMTWRTDFGGSGSSVQTYTGISVEDWKSAKWPEVPEATDKPISKFLPLIRAALDFDFSSLNVQLVEFVLKDDGGAQIVQSYGPVVVGTTRRGDISAIVASNFYAAIKAAEQDRPVAEFTAEMYTARDYNYGTTLDRLLSPADPLATYDQSVGSMEIAGMAFSTADERFAGKVGRVGFSDVGVRPPSVDVFGMIDELVVDSLASQAEPSDDDIIALVASAYGAFSMGRFEISDIEARGPDMVSFSLGSFFVSDYADNALGAFGISALDFDGDKGEAITIERFAFEDMTFAPFDAFIGLEEAIENQDIPAILATLPTLGRVLLSGVMVDVPDEKVSMSLDSSIFEMLDHVGPIPTGMRLGVDGLRLDVDALDPEDRKPFEELGLDTVVVTSDTLLKWDRPSENINLDFIAAVEQMGTLSGEGIVGNVPAVVFDQPDSTTVFALTGTTMNEIALRFDDDGLIERAIALSAREEGIEYGAMELRLKGMIPVFLSELDDPILANQLADSLNAVVETGASLSLKAVAKTPLPLAVLAMSVQGPAALASMFDIEVSNP
ncbi:MAG: hypothetical protein AAFP80_00360 [Pseudomonadota bacterium]